MPTSSTASIRCTNGVDLSHLQSIIERAADARAPEIRPPLSGRVNAKVESLATSLVTQIQAPVELDELPGQR